MSRVETVAISGLREIADRFDHVLLDQWGTLHEGKAVFSEARACVRALRAAGKRVLILSNSGRRSDDNLRRLAGLGFPAKEHDGVLTSGEVAWQGLRDRSAAPFDKLGRRCLLVARGNALSMVEGLDVAAVIRPARAEFIWLAGLDDESANPEDWREDLVTFAARGLPMLCANPDLTMFTSHGMMPAPGALAQLYAALGGHVHYVGKPHEMMFAEALKQLADPPRERVLVIGDSLDHDIQGGRSAGMLTAVIASGIHAKQLAGTRDIAAAVRSLAGGPMRTPHWAIQRLIW